VHFFLYFLKIAEIEEQMTKQVEQFQHRLFLLFRFFENVTASPFHFFFHLHFLLNTRKNLTKATTYPRISAYLTFFSIPLLLSEDFVPLLLLFHPSRSVGHLSRPEARHPGRHVTPHFQLLSPSPPLRWETHQTILVYLL
jgi:hypothetical protein